LFVSANEKPGFRVHWNNVRGASIDGPRVKAVLPLFLLPVLVLLPLPLLLLLALFQTHNFEM